MADSLTDEELAALPPDGGPRFNRLVFEKSPYLLQHARNPVDWRPWNKDTLRAAKEAGKPIFLSVGYSTCHWCHVMERESFEREEVAEILNAHYIPVKVDREERPDLDDAYLLATQVLAGRGGWPNSLWLTPEGKPWAAGTYIPREDRGGHPGFKSLLLRGAEFWRTRRPDAERLGEQVAQAMRQASSPGGEAEGGTVSGGLCEHALEEVLRNFDRERGGFIGAPKFPPHGALGLLIRELRRERRPELLDAFELSLDAMARGGVHDHLGGGFHRYSTDAEWRLPHFEKMLYDNAQLLAAYADAYALTGEARYRRVAEGICAWALREMAHPEGGFFSAMDADSEGEEGKFYVWTRAEISEALGEEDADFFCGIYGVKEGGNFRDEATGRRTGANVLHLAQPLEATARERGMAPEALEGKLRPLREKLLSVRNERVWPHLDDKVLADWNGLMVSGLVRAGRAFGEIGHIRAAERAARFVLCNLTSNGRLMRSWREGAATVPACLTDYALFATACLDLHEATGDGAWLGAARRLAEDMAGRFADEGGGFFLTEEGQEAGFLRGKPVQDQQMPSGNGAAAALLVRLARTCGEHRFADLARRTLQHFEPIMRRAPLAATSLILAAADYLESGSAYAAGSEGRPVQGELRLGEAQVARGQSVPLELALKVAEGYSVPALGAEPEGTRPTRVRLASPGFLALDGLAGKPGEEVEGQPGPVWRGAVRLRASLRAAADAPLGRATVRVEVDHQACGDGACLPPGTLAVGAEVEIVEPEKT